MNRYSKHFPPPKPFGSLIRNWKDPIPILPSAAMKLGELAHEDYFDDDGDGDDTDGAVNALPAVRSDGDVAALERSGR